MNFRIRCASIAYGTGIFCSIATIIPSQDIVATKPFSLKASQVIQALFINIEHPGMHFNIVFPRFMDLTRDVLLWVLIAGLLIRPHIAFLFFAGIVLLGAFFSTIYPSALRHQGLSIIFMLSLYWIAYQQMTGDTKSRLKWQLCFIHKASVYFVLSAIFVFHIAASAYKISTDISKEKSSSKAFGKFITTHSEYHNAIILGEPDYILESLPYYASNRIYMPRERRFGNRVVFTTANKARMSLGELLSIAQQVRNSERAPVLIAIGHLDLSNQPRYEISYSCNKIFTWSPEELAAFKSQTTKAAEFKKAIGDENYEIYLLN